MVNLKITELPDLPTPAADDIVAIVDDPSGSPITKKITYANFEAALSLTAVQISDFDTEVANNSAVTANTAKATNVSTNLSAGSRTPTTMDVDSSDGASATLAEADTTNAGILGSGKWDEIVANTAKTGVTTEISNVVEDTTPQLGGDLDLNQKSIILDPTPTSDHTWNGKIATFTAGEAVVLGDVCYLKSDGKYWKMDADAEATTKGHCVMATGTISADAAGIFLFEGFIRDDTWTWTVGAELFVNLTPGNPSETKPSVTGDIIRLVGYAYSADVIYFNPDKTYIEKS